jgi:serine/threonine-protein kinase
LGTSTLLEPQRQPLPAASVSPARSICTLAQEFSQPKLDVRASHAGLLPDNFGDLIAKREQLIPGYCLVDEIGRGAMGVVYRALRESDGRVVALKTIIPNRRDNPRELRRFLREAEILRQLDHPHIVRCEDIGEAHGLLYFAMEYIPAMNAMQLLQAYPHPFPIAPCVELACQLLDALQAAHERGFVHRDVKPSNILVLDRDRHDVVKLSDFGLARVYQASRLSGLTLTGSFGGTMGYVAPEQITAFRDCLPTSDQYSAAATLYHLLTRNFIHDLPKELGQQIRTVLEARPIPIEQRCDGIPRALAQAIHKALSRDPAERFASCMAFRNALRAG